MNQLIQHEKFWIKLLFYTVIFLSWHTLQNQMVTTGLQVLIVVLELSAWIGMVSTTAAMQWRINHIAGTVLEEHNRWNLYSWHGGRPHVVSPYRRKTQYRPIRVSVWVFVKNYLQCVISITGLPGHFLLDFRPKFLNNSVFENKLFDYILK